MSGVSPKWLVVHWTMIVGEGNINISWYLLSQFPNPFPQNVHPYTNNVYWGENVRKLNKNICRHFVKGHWGFILLGGENIDGGSQMSDMILFANESLMRYLYFCIATWMWLSCVFLKQDWKLYDVAIVLHLHSFTKKWVGFTHWVNDVFCKSLQDTLP